MSGREDVYVEKPVCHNLSEGRKWLRQQGIQRIVQSGICYRSSKAVKKVLSSFMMVNWESLHAKGITYRYRVPIEHIPDSPIPEGVHWDLSSDLLPTVRSMRTDIFINGTGSAIQVQQNLETMASTGWIQSGGL